MVIQSNMPLKAIISVWEETREVFIKYNIPINDLSLEAAVDPEHLEELIGELNKVVGSSENTCVQGG